MRRSLPWILRGTVLIGVVALSAPPLVAGGPKSKPKVSCKKVRDAVWAGHTLDQILAEFDTDAQTVMKCTQKRGKRRAAPKAPKASKAKAKPKKRPSMPSSTTSHESQPRYIRPPTLPRAPHPLP